MKIQHKIIGFSVILGAVVWILDAVLDFFLLHEGSFIEILIFHMPSHHFYIRLVGIISFFIFGILIAKFVTLHRKAEENLRKEQEKAQKYLNIAGVILVVIDYNQRVSLINKKGCQVLGYRQKDIIGKNWFDNFLPESNRNEVKYIFNKLIKAEIQPLEYIEGIILTKSGEERTISWHNTLIKDEQGNIISTLSSGEDITERKRAEDNLKRAHSDLNQMFNAAVPLCVISKDHIMIRVNDTFCSFFGLKREDVIGKICSEIWEDPICNTIGCPLTQIVGGKKQCEKEIEKKLNERKSVSCIVTAIPYRDINGELLGIVENFTDITARKQTEEELKKYRFHLEELVNERTTQLQQEVIERKQSEEALRKSEDRWHKYFELGLIGIAVGNPEKEILECNDHLCEILGYPREELLKMTWSDLTYSEDLESDLEQYNKILTEKIDGYSIEKRCLRKDGAIIHIILSTKCVRCSDGSVDYLVTLVQDISERKKMEEELRKLDKLESVGILAGGIAHDFNNMLTGILGNLSMAEMYVKPGDKIFDSIIRAKKASKNAGQLTQQLLTFSKGGAPIKETASISELIKDTARFALRGSRVRCDSSMPDNLWPVEIDKGQMSQVINNLIINANHAMPEGGIIKIDAENATISINDGLPLKGGKYVKISVKDAGIGIPGKYLSKIFDPYFTTKENGNGLGLATSFGIINKHGGYLTVDSEMGVGTTFYIYLPASEKEPLEVKKIVEELSYFGNHEKILIMDDEQDVIDTAGQMLIELGYEIEIAKNGTEALRLYQKSQEAGAPFDAVILDLTKPGDMGGKETIKKLIEINTDIKAIV